MTPFGVFRGSGKPGEVALYEDWLGRPITHVLDFIGRSSTEPWKVIDDPSWWCARWRDVDRTLILSVAMLPSTAYSLGRGATGDYNAHWQRFASGLVRGGLGDCVIRLGWEFNGRFYPWAAGGNEAQFASYWRRIHKAMRSAGFTGKFDWCPLAGNTGADVEACYPGDAYVDVVGLDAYDTAKAGLTGQERWNHQRTRRIGLDWHRYFAEDHGKPRSFPEWGVTTRPHDSLGGGDNAAYITNMLGHVTLPDVAYHSYFEVDAPDGAHRLMLGQFPNARAALLEGVV